MKKTHKNDHFFSLSSSPPDEENKELVHFFLSLKSKLTFFLKSRKF